MLGYFFSSIIAVSALIYALYLNGVIKINVDKKYEIESEPTEHGSCRYNKIYPTFSLTNGKYSKIPILQETETDNVVLNINNREPFVTSKRGMTSVKKWRKQMSSLYGKDVHRILFGDTYRGVKGNSIVVVPQKDIYFPSIPATSELFLISEDLVSTIGTEVVSIPDMDFDTFKNSNSICENQDYYYIYASNYRVFESLYAVDTGSEHNKNSERQRRSSLSSGWRDLIIIEPIAAKANITVNNTPPIIYMVPPPVTTDTGHNEQSYTAAIQAHYSEFHRMFVQLDGTRGSTRYILSPPESVDRGMYIFPSFHPFYQYSQVPFEAYHNSWTLVNHTSEVSTPPHRHDSRLLQQTHFPEFKYGDGGDDESIWVGDLEVGDVLYVPPYWMCRIEVVIPPAGALLGSGSSRTRPLTSSSFLEVKSASLEQLVLMEAMHIPYPQFYISSPAASGAGKATGNVPDVDLNVHLSRMERLIAAQVYIMHVLSRVKGIQSPRAYIDSLIRQRYPTNSIFHFPESMYSEGLSKSIHHCLQRDEETHERLIRRMNYDVIVRYAKHLAGCFNDPALYVPGGVSMDQGEGGGGVGGGGTGDGRSKNRYHPISSTIRLTALNDFIENLGLWATLDAIHETGGGITGDSKTSSEAPIPLHLQYYNVVVFLKECFNYDNIIDVNDDIFEEEEGNRIRIIDEESTTATGEKKRKKGVNKKGKRPKRKKLSIPTRRSEAALYDFQVRHPATQMAQLHSDKEKIAPTWTKVSSTPWEGRAHLIGGYGKKMKRTSISNDSPEYFINPEQVPPPTIPRMDSKAANVTRISKLRDPEAMSYVLPGGATLEQQKEAMLHGQEKYRSFPFGKQMILEPKAGTAARNRSPLKWDNSSPFTARSTQNFSAECSRHTSRHGSIGGGQACTDIVPLSGCNSANSVNVDGDYQPQQPQALNSARNSSRNILSDNHSSRHSLVASEPNSARSSKASINTDRSEFMSSLPSARLSNVVLS